MQKHSHHHLIRVKAHLGKDKAKLKGFDWADFEGDAVTKPFWVDGLPLSGDAYLLLQVYGINDEQHRIKVNGVDLKGGDLFKGGPGWQTWMEYIDAPLVPGMNSLEIIRNKANDANNFIVDYVAIHYRAMVL